MTVKFKMKYAEQNIAPHHHPACFRSARYLMCVIDTLLVFCICKSCFTSYSREHRKRMEPYRQTQFYSYYMKNMVKSMT